MVDALGWATNEDLHRVAAVATKSWGIPRGWGYEIRASRRRSGDSTLATNALYSLKVIGAKLVIDPLESADWLEILSHLQGTCQLDLPRRRSYRKIANQGNFHHVSQWWLATKTAGSPVRHQHKILRCCGRYRGGVDVALEEDLLTIQLEGVLRWYIGSP